MAPKPKKTAEEKAAAKTAKGYDAANKKVADKVAKKAEKEGKAVYRLDQGESLPGPEPE